MEKKVLEDHKQKGKVFQPPLLAMGTFVETAWIDYAVPEFIWILVLMEKYGIQEGSLMSIKLSSIVDPYITSKINNGSAASMLSFYNYLSKAEKEEIIVEMNKASVLEKFKHAFSPFLRLYPECPLNFLIKDVNNNSGNANDYLKNYKKSLSDFLDKNSIKSSIVMANVIGFLLTVDRFHVTRDSQIPQLDEIFNYPETDESKHLASFLRSSISMCFNIEWGYDRTNSWIKYFWNQGLKIEQCKL
jgi:hypothetical protein